MDLYSAHLALLKKQASELAPVLDKVLSRVQSEQFHDGISLLTVKFYTLLEYISDLNLFCLAKLQPDSIPNRETILDRLVENRLVLEKIKPIEHRMKYQIDSLVRTALTAEPSHVDLATKNNNNINNIDKSNNSETQDFDGDTQNQNSYFDDDEYSYKPKLQSLVASANAEGILSAASASISTADSISKNSEAYQPPKLVPLHFEEDSSLKKRREKAELRMKERSARSQIIKDLVNEFDNRPETSSSWGTSSAIGVAATERLEAARIERTNYEEDHFIRMTESKKQKQLYRQGFKRLDDEFVGLSNFAAINQLQNANSASKQKNKQVLQKRKPTSVSTSLANPSNKKSKSGKFQARKRKA